MSKLKISLSKKSITSLIILGIVLFLGTGTAAGIQMYRQNLSIYEDAAGSYANMVCYQVEMVEPDRIIPYREDIREIQIRMEAGLGSDGDFKPEVFRRVSKDFNPEQLDAYSRWGDVESFIIGLGNICEDVQCAYVIIPTDDDQILVWDSEIDAEHLIIPFEHLPYTSKDKEHVMSVFRGEKPDDFFTETLHRELIGTALTPITDYTGKIVAVAAIDISVSSIRSAFIKLLLNIGIAILLIMLVSITVYHYVIHREVIGPIVTLTKAADGLVNNLRDDGELLAINVHTGDEIDVLARSFEEMDAKLVNYIRENAAITAERERIGTELSLAARIQMNMLPRVFPAFPDRKEIDLYATMRPAREVGGDFYDYYLVDEDRLALIMADVSGKGIPAALFMMMTKIMIQNFMMTLMDPARVMDKVNEQICRNNAEEMFVTVWLGLLNLKTGVLTAVNAGHEYPILKRPGGAFEIVRDRHGLVVGGMDGCHYDAYKLQLTPGSRLFIYTDGLPEATDASEQLFGMERTRDALNEIREGSLREVLDHMEQSIAAFIGSAPVFDDTTMLCLDYFGPSD